MKQIGNIKNTQYLLDKYNLNAKLSLGQNFIVDQKVLEKIIEHIDPSENCAIVEVGPGLGALTEHLVTFAKHVDSIEIDQRMVHVLNELYDETDNLEIIHEDILKVDLNELVSNLRKQYDQVYMVANLPYYISSEILMQAFGLDHGFDMILALVQNEFAQRLISEPNSKAYRPLSVIAKTMYKCKISFNVSKHCFYPKPNVTSSIIKLNKKQIEISHRKDYIEFIQWCFIQKRKTIYNNLRQQFDEDFTRDLLLKANISETLRPAELDIEAYVNLFEVYYETQSLR